MDPRVNRLAAAAVTVLLACPAGAGRAQSYARQAFVAPSARKVELTPSAGLFWSTGVTTAAGTLALDAAPDVGLALDLELDGRSQLELLWLLARPTAHFTSRSVIYADAPPFGVLTQYLQLGGTTRLGQGTVEPFLSGGLGVAWFSPSDVQVEGALTLRPRDAFLLAFHIGGGAKWWLSEALALRLQARFLLPVMLASGAFLSAPDGAALMVNGGIPLLQGEIALGLTIAP